MPKSKRQQLVVLQHTGLANVGKLENNANQSGTRYAAPRSPEQKECGLQELADEGCL